MHVPSLSLEEHRSSPCANDCELLVFIIMFVSFLACFVMVPLQLQFLFELPSRLKKCMEMNAEGQAVRWVNVQCQYRHWGIVCAYHSFAVDDCECFVVSSIQFIVVCARFLLVTADFHSTLAVKYDLSLLKTVFFCCCCWSLVGTTPKLVMFWRSMNTCHHFKAYSGTVCWLLINSGRNCEAACATHQ